MPFTPQHDQMDCGPACLRMVAAAHGKTYPLEYLREKAFLSREGVSLLGISEAAEHIGLETFSAKLSISKLIQQKALLPCILHWNQNHFVVLRKIIKNRFSGTLYFHLADPAHGRVKLSEEKFKKSWLSENNKGVALFLHPAKPFYQKQPPKETKLPLKYLLKYLTPYRPRLLLMFLLLLLGSALTLVFPFLTQALIDQGVQPKNLSFISAILLAQLGLFLGNLTMEILRNRLTLFIGTHLSITIISDFLKKMLRLPIKFFDTKLMGDFNQRIQDNRRIEDFLTSQSLLTFFSILTFSVFFGVLWYYNLHILFIYAVLTFLSIGWSFYFLKKRRQLDYFRFQQQSENQESIYEMLNGVTEMKLNRFEDFKRRQWEGIQQKLFKLNLRVLRLDQWQLSGFDFLNQLKNILVTFLAARLVVQNHMTLGELLSISYIIGQMNAPVNQLINFFRSLQDARLSMERLSEVQHHPQEETKGLKNLPTIEQPTASKDEKKAIELKNVSFQYEGPKSLYVLKNITMSIPKGKVTAIVGASGSGKTTLMKLLLRFYSPVQGEILYGGENLLNLSPKSLREHAGVVMQDGYIFSESIERNIAMSEEKIDTEKVKQAAQMACIDDFIAALPLKYHTKIGAAGNGLSGGQQQRILIARAVYKNPPYLFFDEATSALDAENEKKIHENLQMFFRGKTVVIIAHRLSTVKNADQIIVLKQGKMAERGTHTELVKKRGAYFKLVKNQLELGK